MKKSSPLYKNVQDDIQSKILDGTYKPGQQLLSENEMIDLYNVSRITIRNALNNLVIGNQIKRIRGKGTFVNENIQDSSVYENPDIRINNLKTIAFIIPTLNDTHNMGIFESVYHVAYSLGYSVIVFQTYHTQKLEDEIIKKCLLIHVAGLIIYPVQKEKYSEEIIKLVLARFPTVLIDRALEGINVNSVVTDNEKASYLATKHLMNHGHKKIAFISPLLEYAIPLENRYKGYLKAISEMETESKDSNVWFYNTLSDVMDESGSTLITTDMKAIENFMTNHPDITAYLCAEPKETIMLFDAAKNLKVSIPGQISIIGFDDFTNSDMFSIAPTVVKQNSKAMGEKAMTILSDLITGKKENAENIKIDAELIIRQSTNVNK